MFTVSIGKSATIKMRTQNYAIGSVGFVVYKGTIEPSAPYDPPDTFRMTGDEKMPVRVIALQNVLSLDGTDIDSNTPITTPPKQKRTFDVQGSKGNTYKVSIDSTGRYFCQCAGFGFRKTCKHVDKVAQFLKDTNT